MSNAVSTMCTRNEMKKQKRIKDEMNFGLVVKPNRNSTCQWLIIVDSIDSVGIKAPIFIHH